MRTNVPSRGPWRPSLPAATIKRSTSAGVRCSRLRRSRLVIRRGGATFPFSMDGELSLGGLNARTVLIELFQSFPIRDVFGQVELYVEPFGLRQVGVAFLTQ